MIDILDKVIESNKKDDHHIEEIIYDGCELNESIGKIKIRFQKINKYQKIERYQQANYVKYPIYSDWITRPTKPFYVTENFNAAWLEHIDENSRHEESVKAKYLIMLDLDKKYWPSWFREWWAAEGVEIVTKSVKKANNEITSKMKEATSSIDNDIKYYEGQAYSAEAKIDKYNLKINKIEKRLKNTKRKISVKFWKWRLKKNNKKKDKWTTAHMNYNYSIVCSKHSKKQICKPYEKEINENNLFLENLIVESKELLKANKKLTFDYLKSDKFQPLKTIVFQKYKKIVGCYVIKNKKLNKYYVGQSKDVIKRLRQHFDGTKPKNMIFAEDYFMCDKNERDDLFEIKIISLNTKDELDRVEKEMIEKYDSFKSGYNKTSGND